MASAKSKASRKTSKRANVTPFLTYIGNAESAVMFYVALFEDSEVVSINRYGPDDKFCNEGNVKIAEFTLCGQRFLCSDSPDVHEWTFTPAMSLYVEDPNESAIEKYFQALSKDGKIFMPLDRYPFSKRFGWVEDKFGVSWQLSVGFSV